MFEDVSPESVDCFFRSGRGWRLWPRPVVFVLGTLIVLDLGPHQRLRFRRDEFPNPVAAFEVQDSCRSLPEDDIHVVVEVGVEDVRADLGAVFGLVVLWELMLAVFSTSASSVGNWLVEVRVVGTDWFTHL